MKSSAHCLLLKVGVFYMLCAGLYFIQKSKFNVLDFDFDWSEVGKGGACPGRHAFKNRHCS